MAVYKSAMGKAVDMTTLATKNEKVRAVGNMKVNARGDTIDSMGRVIRPVTEKVNKAYAKTVGNRSAQAQSAPPASPKAPVAPVIEEAVPQAPIEELSESELEIEASLEDDLEVEQIKAAEVKKGKK